MKQLNVTYTIQISGKVLLRSCCTQRQIVEAAQRLADEREERVSIWYGNQELTKIEPSVKRRPASLVAALATARVSRGPIMYSRDAYTWWHARADECYEDADGVEFRGEDSLGPWKQRMCARPRESGRIDPSVYDSIQDVPTIKYICYACGQVATRPGTHRELRGCASTDTQVLKVTK